jgi:redox-sensitive bicupin YhaK (pirin superfamily)
MKTNTKTMMRPANERLLTNISWLKSYHTFSFGEHYDPKWMGFRNLRVINDDYIRPDSGFPFHPHKNMEIITFLMEGKLLHKDNLGNSFVIAPGELQVMSAGRGIIHSEEAVSETSQVHLLQIWIMPKEDNISPRYSQKNIQGILAHNSIGLIASGMPIENDSVMPINANANLWHGKFDGAFEYEFKKLTYSNLWLHMIDGEIEIENQVLRSGDAIGIEDAQTLTKIASNTKAEFLLFELA